MIPIRHLLARSKKTSMATEATPPPMSSKVKPACPAAAEVTVSVTDLASTPSRGDDGGGDDGEGGTYVGHFCSYVPPSFLQSVLQVERFQHFLLHFLSFFFESSGHSFLHVLTSSSSLQNFLQNFLSEHDNGELGVGAGGELGGGEGEGGGGLGGGSGGGEGDSVGVPGGDGGDAGDGGDHAEPQSPSLQSVTPKAVMRTRLPSNLERRNELCSALRATVCNICCRYVSA